MWSASRTSPREGDRKKNGCWTCRQCACRYTQLARSWVGWPPTEFDAFSSEEANKFWQDVGACDTNEEQEQLVAESLTQVVEETRCGGTGGEYLPLSVYKTRGFDTTLIEELCDDKKPSRMFGTVYRVDIEYQTKETKEKRIREAILQSVQERRGGGGGVQE